MGMSHGIGLYRPPGPVVLNSASRFRRGLMAWWPCGPTAREIAFAGQASSVDAGFVATEILNNIGAEQSVGSLSALEPRPSAMGMVLHNDGGVGQLEVSTTASRWDFSASEATFACWVKLRLATPVSTTTGGFPFTFNSDETSGSLYPFTDGLLYLGVFDTVRNLNGVALLASVTRTDWHLITLTTKAGTNGYRFFQNGQLAAQATRNGFSSTFGASLIYLMASQLGGGNQYRTNGWACDFRLWNRALSDADVYALYDPFTRWELYGRPELFEMDQHPTGGGGGAGKGRGGGKKGGGGVTVSYPGGASIVQIGNPGLDIGST